VSDALEALLAQIPDGPMKDALRAEEPDFAEEVLLDYLKADADSQADIRAFFDCGGPAMVERARQEITRDEDGTPTAKDLAEWVGEEPLPEVTS
jgi:hypothetical protein